jgi:O-antigen/teichoic acid export membrane protein
MKTPTEATDSKPSIATATFSMFQRDVIIYVTLFFTSIFIARTLGPTQMGLWSILLLLPSYAAGFGRPMTDTASVYFIARKELTVTSAASALATISIAMWLIVLVVFFVAQSWLFDSPLRHFQGLQWLPMVMLVVVLLDFFTMNYMYLLLAEEDVRSYNWFVLIKSTLAPSLGVVLLLALGPEIKYMVFAVIIGNSAALLYGFARVHRSHSFSLSFDTRTMRILLSYGAKLYVGSIIGFMGFSLASGIVASYLTEESTAFFQIALTRAFLLAKLTSAFGTILYPRIASLKNDWPGAVALFTTVSRANVLITVVVAAVTIALANPAIGLLYGEGYAPVVVPFMILIVGAIFIGIEGMINSLFNAKGRPLIPTVLSAAVIVPQIGALALFVPNGDIIIAAWITTGAFFAGAVLKLIAVKRVFGINLTDLMIPRKSDIVLIISGISRIVRRGR